MSSKNCVFSVLPRESTWTNCPACGKNYRTRHKCSGSSHRPRKVTLLAGTALHAQRPRHELAVSLVSDMELSFFQIRGLQDILKDYGKILLHRATTWRTERSVYRSESVYRQSVVLRLQGDVHGSRRVLNNHISHVDSGSSNGRNSDLSALQLSQAVNHAYDYEFREAHLAMKKCRPESASMLWDYCFTAGRILKGEGVFEKAWKCFDTCLLSPQLPDSRRCLVRSTMADLYCELDYLEGAECTYLELAQELILPDIWTMRDSGRTHCKSFRRLLLALVEVRIRQNDYNEAQYYTRELLYLYARLEAPDIVDRLGHVRVLIAAARLCTDPQEAVGWWSHVLDWNGLYNPDEGDVFTCGVAYLYRGLLLNGIGGGRNGTADLQHGVLITATQAPRFIIPGIGTYLFNDVLARLGSVSREPKNIPPPLAHERQVEATCSTGM